MPIEKHKDYIMIDGNDGFLLDKFGFNKISLSDLQELFREDDFIPYAQYLRTHNWESKRLEILERDNFRCTKCNSFETKYVQNKVETPFGTVVARNLEWNDVEFIMWTDIDGKERKSKVEKPKEKPVKPYNLQVHHKKYILNKFPWDYENKDLQTLCNYCHSDVHEKMDVPVYNEDGNIVLDYNNCERCDGTGYLTEYKHVQGGICFGCRGARFSILIINKKFCC
jgi:5-methylcytosine-specific restriction endonuclease McrA